MIRIFGARWPLSEVKVIPVRVQGEEAPQEIAAAIQWANLRQVADLLVTGRGGGSMEDLWAFNEEIVARAIYDTQTPIISAVGHEPDVTIADFVADLRASTPPTPPSCLPPTRTRFMPPSWETVSAWTAPYPSAWPVAGRSWTAWPAAGL